MCGSHRGQQQQQGVDGEVDGGPPGPLRGLHVPVDRVDELHGGGDRGVVRPAFVVTTDPINQPVGRFLQLLVGLRRWTLDQGDALHAPRRQPPHPAQEPIAAFHHLVALGAPLEVVRGRPDEQVEQAQRVGSDRCEVVLGRDQVAPGLGHLGAVEGDHPLSEQPGERLPYPRRRQAHVGQGPGVEAGVQQVQDGVLDPADVLVDGHPVGGRCLVDRLRRWSRDCRSARNTRTSRRRCPWCRSPARPGRHTSDRWCAGRPRRSAGATHRSAGTRRRRAAGPAAGPPAPERSRPPGSAPRGSGSPSNAGATGASPAGGS